MAPVLSSITHLQLSTGIFRGALSQGLSVAVSKFLLPLAAHCPTLETLSINGDVGVELLQTFSATCLCLVSFVEVVNSLPPSTSLTLTQLMPRLAMHTVMYEVGDWRALIEAVTAVTAPTTFDLCGRMLLCRHTMYVGGYDGVILRNGTICIQNPEYVSAPVFYVSASGLRLESLIVCDVRAEQFLKTRDVGFHSDTPGYESDRRRDKFDKYPLPSKWTGVKVCNGGFVSISRCEVLGAAMAVHMVELDYEFGAGNQQPCNVYASELTVRTSQSGNGLLLQGSFCNAELVDCNFRGGEAICIKGGSQLTAQRFRIDSKHVAVSVYEGSVAHMSQCTFVNRPFGCVLVHGKNSLVHLRGCFVDKEVELAGGGWSVSRN